MFLGCLVSVHSFGQLLLSQYLMNSLNNFDKTDMEYSLAPSDDLIRMWSLVRVTA